MKRNLTDLSRQYQALLRQNLEQNPPTGSALAQELGRQAMAFGLETLDLARIHAQAMSKVILPGYSPGSRGAMVRRAGAFFAQAITPIEMTHRVAKETNAQLEQLNETLRQRSADLAASNRTLKEQIEQRKLAEQALKKSEQHYGHLLAQSRLMQEQLRLLSRQLLSAQEEERKKISRELHDVIAQTLTSINVQLSNLRSKAAFSTKGLERSIERTQRLVVRSVDIVHRFARELRPTVLDDLGLIPALHTFMKSFTEETGIRVSLSAFKAVRQINNEDRTVLFRVAQEALTNVARHAHASQAQVEIQKLDGTLCMTIHDDGQGFQEAHVLHARRGKRLGLLGMRERLEMVGGKFTITSMPGKGTTVQARIPLAGSATRGGKHQVVAAKL